jgi:integrase/recombinase XerC
MAADYRLALEAENKSSQTVAVYGSALERFAEWLESKGLSTSVAEITRKDCRGFIDHLLRTKAPATAHNRFRSLKTFFAWLVSEEELDRSPMEAMQPPAVPDKPVDIVTEEEMRRLLKLCENKKDFASRRDAAMLRLFYDTGIRRNELADLKISDVDTNLNVVMVVGKGGCGDPARRAAGAPLAQTPGRSRRARLGIGAPRTTHRDCVRSSPIDILAEWLATPATHPPKERHPHERAPAT